MRGFAPWSAVACHRLGSNATGDRKRKEITESFRVPNPKREQARALQGPACRRQGGGRRVATHFRSLNEGRVNTVFPLRARLRRTSGAAGSRAGIGNQRESGQESRRDVFLVSLRQGWKSEFTLELEKPHRRDHKDDKVLTIDIIIRAQDLRAVLAQFSLWISMLLESQRRWRRPLHPVTLVGRTG